jgi:hypothetical protein
MSETNKLLKVITKNRKDVGTCMLHKNTGNYKKVIEIRIGGDTKIRVCSQHGEELIKQLKNELEFGRIW